MQLDREGHEVKDGRKAHSGDWLLHETQLYQVLPSDTGKRYLQNTAYYMDIESSPKKGKKRKYSVPKELFAEYEKLSEEQVAEFREAEAKPKVGDAKAEVGGSEAAEVGGSEAAEVGGSEAAEVAASAKVLDAIAATGKSAGESPKDGPRRAVLIPDSG